jgi:hypothetical protein
LQASLLKEYRSIADEMDVTSELHEMHREFTPGVFVVNEHSRKQAAIRKGEVKLNEEPALATGSGPI